MLPVLYIILIILAIIGFLYWNFREDKPRGQLDSAYRNSFVRGGKKRKYRKVIKKR